MHGAYLSLSKPADDPKGALEGSRASRAQGFADRQIVDNSAGGSSGKKAKLQSQVQFPGPDFLSRERTFRFCAAPGGPQLQLRGA
jgi:hypothetical protein